MSAAHAYASEAMRCDLRGDAIEASANYRVASDLLDTHMGLYPCRLDPLLRDLVASYRDRIRNLSAPDPEGPSAGPPAPPTKQRAGVGATQAHNAFDDIVTVDRPDMSWSDVAGLDDAKSALRESIVYPSVCLGQFPSGLPRGTLLYGPPGCGKTLLAAAAASEVGGYLVHADAASMTGKWLDDSEKNVSKMFEIVRGWAEMGDKPVILLIDGVDALLGLRSGEAGGKIRAKNQLLVEMDGVNGGGGSTRLYVVAATDKPWCLDWPFLRRFQRRIYVGLPELEGRQALLKLYTGPLKMDPKLSITALARMLDGYSAEDIKDVCQLVQIKVVHELLSSPEYNGASENEALMQSPRVVTIDDFEEVMSKRKPSISQEMLAAYRRIVRAYRERPEAHGNAVPSRQVYTAACLTATSNYQKAIDSLVKLMRLYPGRKINELYRKRIDSYLDRIERIRDSGPDHAPYGGGQ